MSFSVRVVAGAMIIAAVTGCGGGGGGATSATGLSSGTNGGTGAAQPVCAANTVCMLFSTSTSTYSGTDGTGAFSPASLTVSTGATVTFSNASGVAHDVQFDSAVPQGGNIGVISSGAQSRTFTAAGVYPFHCAIHQGMVGTVTVQ